ncbi:MAG TPA: hypothetical protein VKX34_09035 [Aequorivita sp.]|nr:hypothetical protein [Aequorivita sp.]
MAEIRLTTKLHCYVVEEIGLKIDIFVFMKRLLFLLFFLPLIGSAQLDFESYKGKLNFVELPVVPDVIESPLFAQSDNTSSNTSRRLPSFKLSKKNYREPVSVFEAMAEAESYVKSDIELNLNAKSYGISGGNSSYSSDGSTKVKNIAYKDASRGFLFADTCPPNGICPRCAPYRMGGRFY